MPKMNSQSGFTLIELLVVISIISLLSSIILVATVNARRSARDSVRKQNMSQIASALELYYTDNNQYPTTTGWFGEPSNAGSMAQDVWIPGLVPKYLAHLPHDPHTGDGSYGFGCALANRNGWAGYIYQSNGTDYKLLAACVPEMIKQPCGDPTDPFNDTGNPPFTCPGRPNGSWQVQTSGAVNW